MTNRSRVGILLPGLIVLIKVPHQFLSVYVSCILVVSFQLKSQIPVLKKAYLDEQSAHNQLKVRCHLLYCNVSIK